MPKALQHEYPRFERPTDNSGAWTGEEAREVWNGHMRAVSPRRARKLRQRGVPLMPLHRVRTVQVHNKPERHEPTTPNGRARYAWFEPVAAVESRRRTKALHCYLVATRPEPFGRKGWLAARLVQQRAYAQQAPWIRRAQQRELTVQHTPPTHVVPYPNEAKLNALLLAQSRAGLHYDDCDCSACDGSLDIDCSE